MLLHCYTCSLVLHICTDSVSVHKHLQYYVIPLKFLNINSVFRLNRMCQLFGLLALKQAHTVGALLPVTGLVRDHRLC